MANKTDISIVVVDDDPSVGRIVAQHLAELGCGIRVFTDPVACLKFLETSPADIVITDLKMPGVDGLTVLRTTRERNPSTEVIVITANADKESAIQALKLGAFDFFEKPVHREELVETIKRTIRYQTALAEKSRLEKQLSFVSEQEARRSGLKAFIGRSAAVKAVLDQVRMLQAASGTSVLITGESSIADCPNRRFRCRSSWILASGIRNDRDRIKDGG